MKINVINFWKVCDREYVSVKVFGFGWVRSDELKAFRIEILNFAIVIRKA